MDIFQNQSQAIKFQIPVSKQAEALLNKFIQQVESIFKNLAWPLTSSKKPDMVFFDPPYFKKMVAHYKKGSISDFTKPQYLNFFKHLFRLMRDHSKPSTRLAFLNADFRDFQGVLAYIMELKNLNNSFMVNIS